MSSFMPQKSTTDGNFALKVLIGEVWECQKDLSCVFVDLKEACDKLSGRELWYCMRKPGVAEKYVRVVQYM